MTAYTHFIKCFSERCNRLLKTFFTSAQMIDTEVTFMLSIASTGITIPYERLRPDTEKKVFIHPSGDREKAENLSAASEFRSLFDEDKTFRGSDFWDEDAGSWCTGEVHDPSRTDADYWNFKPMSEQKKIGTVLNVLRNALAHGNIFMRTENNDDQSNIDQIVFLSAKYYGSDEFYFVAVSPSDFHQFLLNWFKYMSKLSFPESIIDTRKIMIKKSNKS